MIAAGALLGLFALLRGAADYRAYNSPFDQVYSPAEYSAGFLPVLSAGLDSPAGTAPNLGPVLLSPQQAGPGLLAARLLAADHPGELSLEALPAHEHTYDPASQKPGASAPAFLDTALDTDLDKQRNVLPAAPAKVWVPEGIYIPALNLRAPILPGGRSGDRV